MAFDPDTYLAKRLGGQAEEGAAPAVFDADAYLAAKNAKKPGKLESFLRGAKQGASLNFGDEITAGVESLFTEKTYDQAVAEARANDSAAEQENPLTYGGGGLAGGLATAFVPGLGAGKIAQAGGTAAKIGQAALLGGKLGGIGAVGASESSDVGDNLEAAVHGAGAGALGGAVLQGGGMLIGKAGRAIGKRLVDAVKPQTQLALAVGATSKELNPANEQLYKKVANAVTRMETEGLFADAPHGSLDEQELWRRVQGTLKTKGEAIGAEVRKYGDKVVPETSFRRVYMEAADRMKQAIESSPPGARGAAESELGQALSELEATGGKLADIWKLKSQSGGWASKAWTMSGQPPPVKEGFMGLNRVLDDFLTSETGVLAEQSQSSVLKGLNASYSAASTIEPMLGNLIGKLEAAPGSLGFSARDLGAGGMLGGVAAGMGAGPLAAPLGMAGAALNQWGRTVPGRVKRAEIGRALEGKAAAASVAMGAIARTTTEAQAWLKSRLPSLPPEMQGAAAAIVGAPSDRAEQMLRAVMPQFSQHFAKSSYPSELDGRVSSEDDKVAIRKRLQTLQLPSTTMALRLSALNSKGIIPIESYDSESYGEDLQQLVVKMMGPQ